MSIRISDSYISKLLVGDLNRSLAQMLEQQRMAGTMRRVNSYVDDPRAIASIGRLEDLIAGNTNYLNNVGRSRTLIDTTDSALQEISNLLSEVRVIALRESSGLGDNDTMAISADEVENLRGRLNEILNTSVEGQYIFAGRRTDTPPFEDVNGIAVYQGDSGEIRSDTGPHSSMVVNISGQEFMDGRGYFGVLENLRTALVAEDHAAVLAVVNGLDGLESNLSRLLMLNGGRQNDLDWAESTLTARDERLRSSLAMEQDADVAQIATDLSRTQAAYQASLLVTSRLFEFNLMDYLR